MPAGEFLAKNGKSTFVCSETQKFGHVTFFWNGNRSGYFDEKLETYVEVRLAHLFLSFFAVCLNGNRSGYFDTRLGTYIEVGS